MANDSMGTWISSRRPPVPGAFQSRLEVSADEVLAPGVDGRLPERLADAGARRLAQAMERPGKDRESAFLLLAADGLVTYACEAAADTVDPARALEDVLARVVEKTS